MKFWANFIMKLNRSFIASSSDQISLSFFSCNASCISMAEASCSSPDFVQYFEACCQYQYGFPACACCHSCLCQCCLRSVARCQYCEDKPHFSLSARKSPLGQPLLPVPHASVECQKKPFGPASAFVAGCQLPVPHFPAIWNFIFLHLWSVFMEFIPIPPAINSGQAGARTSGSSLLP